MKTAFESKRHPLAISAVLFAALVAAGCGSDDSAMNARNPAKGQGNVQGSGFAQGPVYAQGSGPLQGQGYAQGSGPLQGPGYAQGSGPMQGAGYAQGSGPMQGAGYAQGPGSMQGGGHAPGAGPTQGGGYAPRGGYGQDTGARPVRNGQDAGNARRPGSAPESYDAGNIPGQGRMIGERGGGLEDLMAWERQDMGVRPERELHTGPMHGPTPNQIPGGQVITTKGLLPLLQQGIPVHVFDVLGTGQTLPNAIPASFAAEGGSFDDGTQQQFAQMLQQVTRGNPNAALVFYCQGPQCWMSYNASLRAVALGYRNVLWYRGGMEAWQQAGQRFAPAQRQG